MPKAYAVADQKKFDLKTCTDGFVILKRLTYGKKLERRELMKMSVAFGKNKNAVGEMAMASKQSNYLEFADCIVEHNLEKDDNGTLFNFKNPADVDMLDPRIGEEIDKLISAMNNFDEDDDLK